MTYKAIYLCCIADPWISVAQDLKLKGIDPVYFVHWKSDQEAFSQALGSTCHLQTVEDAWKGEGFPAHTKPIAIDEPLYKNVAWYELNALKMMDRLDPLGNDFGFQERRYFFQDLLGYWLACIEKFGINVVVSPSVPHRVFDYALYVACQIKNIRFLMFQMVPFGSTSLIIEDIDSVGEFFDSGTFSKDYVGVSPEIIEKLSKVRKDYKTAIPAYMLKHEKNQNFSFKKFILSIVKACAKILLFNSNKNRRPNTYWVKKGELPAASYYSWFDFYKAVFFRRLKVKNFEEEYKRLTSESLPSQFILLALHYQPEETSCPTGGSYVDQINMIKILDEVLPDGIGIVVKEHKSQFYTHQEGASGRDSSFYKRLNSIASDRTNFSSVDTTPFDLIDKAIATVTISGTIGWESAVRGTPTLVFGRAWYESMPRVHKVKSKKDIIEALTKIQEEKNADMDDAIRKFHGWLEKKTVRAKHYKAVFGNSDIDLEESRKNLVKAIHERLWA